MNIIGYLHAQVIRFELNYSEVAFKKKRKYATSANELKLRVGRQSRSCRVETMKDTLRSHTQRLSITSLREQGNPLCSFSCHVWPCPYLSPLCVDSFHCLSDFLKIVPTVFLIPAGGKHKALRRWFLEGWWGRAKRLE